MRIASFNVENMFCRATVMNRKDWTAGQPVLERFAKLNALICLDTYDQQVKAEMLQLLIHVGLEKRDESRWVILRQNRGHLVRRPRGGDLEIAAAGRNDWIGWLELKTEAVQEVATENTARIIRDVNADVLAVIEAEDRIALRRFNEQVIPAVGGTEYGHIMLIDGNDDRGIDVGLLTRDGFPINQMRSHVDDHENGRRIFSRDCPEYQIMLPSGAELLVLVNHLKSKGYGDADENDARRKKQAERIRAIYDERRQAGAQFIAIIGDLNDTPERDPLTPLLGNGSGLKDVSEYDAFDDGGHPGTYGNCGSGNKIDYILLSPELFTRVKAGGINRTGVWSGKKGGKWKKLAELTKPSEAASDHAAVWADIDL